MTTWTPIRDALAGIVERHAGDSLTEWPDDVCERCLEPHECRACCDGGRVLVTMDLRDPQFGRTVLCPSCRGEREETAPAETLERALERMRVPLAFRHARFGMVREDVRRQLMPFIAQRVPEHPFVLLTGDVGVGKTFAACALLVELYERHEVRGQFWPVIDLLDRYRATFEDTAVESTSSIDAMLRRAGVLVLDDLGKHKSTEYAEQALFRIVDEWSRSRRPLIVTSNVPASSLPEALRSRVLDRGTATVVAMDGEDRRLAG